MSEYVTTIIRDPCVENYVRYLGAFRIVESDYGLFDKLARPRDFEDFARVVYESVRVQERVLRKLKDGISKGEYVVFMMEETRGTEETEKIEEIEIDKLFRVGKNCLAKIMEFAKENPRLVGSIIASLALAYDGVREVGRER